MASPLPQSWRQAAALTGPGDYREAALPHALAASPRRFPKSRRVRRQTEEVTDSRWTWRHRLWGLARPALSLPTRATSSLLCQTPSVLRPPSFHTAFRQGPRLKPALPSCSPALGAGRKALASNPSGPGPGVAIPAGSPTSSNRGNQAGRAPATGEGGRARRSRCCRGGAPPSPLSRTVRPVGGAARAPAEPAGYKASSPRSAAPGPALPAVTARPRSP